MHLLSNRIFGEGSGFERVISYQSSIIRCENQEATPRSPLLNSHFFVQWVQGSGEQANRLAGVCQYIDGGSSISFLFCFASAELNP
jgi:hypothetical protein